MAELRIKTRQWSGRWTFLLIASAVQLACSGSLAPLQKSQDLSSQNPGTMTTPALSSQAGILNVQASQQQNSQTVAQQLALGELPSGMGVSLQAPAYSGVGLKARGFVDGAREAHRLGFKTFKISMAREALVIPSFYHLAELESKSQTQLESQVQSLRDLAQLKSYDYVLSLPFETIFLQTTEIRLDDPQSHYWNMATVPLSPTALNRIYQEHYELGVYLLTRYKGSARTFVLQDHEADWHAAIWNGSSYSENTAIGHANYLKYWPIRQKAIDDARRAVQSDVRLLHMCEVVRLRETVLSGAKSLARDVLPQVNCDLIGYSAHDTALLPDDGATLKKAIEYLRANSQASPKFGRNHVVLSEIAVPELFGGAYLPRTTQVVRAMDQALREGMPWVLYWQFYDNDNVGNWIVKPNNDFGSTFYALLAKLGLEPQKLAQRVAKVPQFNGQMTPQPTPAPTPAPTPLPTPGPTPQPSPTPVMTPQPVCSGAMTGYRAYFCATYQLIYSAQPTLSQVQHFENLFQLKQLGCVATVRDLLKHDPLRLRAANISDLDSQRNYIQKLYPVMLGRSAMVGDNPAGILALRQSGASLDAVDDIFYQHPEMKLRCSSFGLQLQF
ncbi:MAG TPA: hypothetical protein PLZ57_05950 [Pseudobdellovibrionaceae bacterium]|nr:hypothetical protein [Pseudobdellovibrionaceae bacterium]